MKILKAEQIDNGFKLDIHVDEEKVLPDTKQPDPRYILTTNVDGVTLDEALITAHRQASDYLNHLNFIDGISDAPSIGENSLSHLEGQDLNELIETNIKTSEEPTNLVPSSTAKDSKAKKVRKSTAVRKAMEAQSAEKTPNVNKEEGDKNPVTPPPVIGDKPKQNTKMAKITKDKK